MQCLEIAHKLRPEIEELLDLPVDLVVQSAQHPLKQISKSAKASGITLWSEGSRENS